MSLIKISQFGGMFPKLGSRILAPSSARYATNVKLNSGEALPLNDCTFVYTPNKSLPVQSIYQARSGLNASAWFTWNSDVDVAKAPLSIDSEARFYWTGDGTPKYATYTLATSSGLANYPSNAYALGIPTPQNKPAVAAVGGSSATVSRYYVMTFFSALGEESAPSLVSDLVTGKVDSTWNITNLDAFPINTSTGTGTFSSGVTTFTDTASANHWLRAGDEIVINSSTVTVNTVINAYSFTVLGNYSTAISWARKYPWNTTGIKRRLYRTAGTIATFQLVTDNVSGTSYADTITDGAILGDELISQGWFPPPVGLTGICEHPSGSLIGFVDNVVWMSEPYQPHAWPTKYKKSLSSSVVGISVFGTEIGVATQGNPYVISGVDPSSMSVDKKNGLYPCLAKRSVIGVDDGFMYATQYGLVYIGSSGISIVTDNFYTKDSWQLLNPTSIVASAAYGRVFVSYTTTDNYQAILIIDGGVLTSADVNTMALYTDKNTGKLYLSDSVGIKEWDSNTNLPLTLNWRSKDFVLPAPENMGAAKIDFDLAIDPSIYNQAVANANAVIASNNLINATGFARGFLNGRPLNHYRLTANDYKIVPALPAQNSVSFILRADNKVIITKNITSGSAFKLPSGYKSDVYSMEVSSQCKIKEIRLAQTMNELRDA